MNAQKSRIAEAFSRSAHRYEQASQLQAEVATALAHMAVKDLPEAPRILEIGCGTGGLTRHLLDEISDGTFLITDIAPTMVETCRERCADPRATFAHMDGEHPDLGDGQYDLIVSSLAMQWFADLRGGIAVLSRHLVPGGRLVFSTLGHDTFINWRKAHADLGLKDGTPDYPTPQAVGRMWPKNGQGRVCESRIERPYDNARTFARRLKTIGANTPAAGHRPLSPKAFRQIATYLGDNFTDQYHIIYATFTKA